MSRWFRFYAEALDDPKVQKLDGDTFKAWVNLLCLTTKNGGVLPANDDIAFALRIDANGARALVERLLNATLIDKLSGGAGGARYAPHGWQERQYKSDTSTDRVKRFRQRSKPVTETPPETETETETEVSEPNGSSPRLWSCPPGVDPKHWRDFRKNRKTRRLTNSETAYEGQLKAIAEIADDEWPPGRLVQHAAAKGWGSINDPRTNGSSNVRDLQRPRTNPLTDIYRTILDEEARQSDSEDGDGARIALPASGRC